MAMALEKWRDYFRTANSDIFNIIDHAITIAALDCPNEFRLHRDRIAEKLFTCKFTRCSGCDHVELVVPEYGDDNGRGCRKSCKRETDEVVVEGEEEEEEDGCEFFEAGGSKESKANSSGDDPLMNQIASNYNYEDDPLMNQIASNYSYGEAEALTDEIEEESMIIGEVLRIKEVLQNGQDEPDSVLFESLRRLQLMALTFDILKATEIGKVVNRFRKHSSNRIRELARTLVNGWTVLADEWLTASKAIAEGTPESANPSVVDEEEVEEEKEEEEEGLPSPPLDIGALFATQPTAMELSQFFDGMDDDGNPRSSRGSIKNRDNRRKPSQENQSYPIRKQPTSSEANMLIKEDKSQQMKRQEPVAKPNNKPSSTNIGSGRPPKHNVEQKANTESKLVQKSEKTAVPEKPLSSQQDKLKTSDEVSVQRKLEATKRKLQERYQQAENAKRKRTIQVMELHDLPKQNSGSKNPFSKPGNHNRHRANGRR